MGDLSKDFDRSEFACKGDDCCGHSAPIDSLLVDSLQALRDLINDGKSEEEEIGLTINSGFRCITYNATVPGSASDSTHCLGIAADVDTPDGITEDQLIAFAEQIPAFKSGGIGKYPGRVHLDVRNWLARWTVA